MCLRFSRADEDKACCQKCNKVFYKPLGGHATDLFKRLLSEQYKFAEMHATSAAVPQSIFHPSSFSTARHATGDSPKPFFSWYVDMMISTDPNSVSLLSSVNKK